jgi:hypothetical protein
VNADRLTSALANLSKAIVEVEALVSEMKTHRNPLGTRESVRKQRGHSLAAATPHLFMLERNRGKVRIGKGFPNQIILFSLATWPRVAAQCLRGSVSVKNDS